VRSMPFVPCPVRVGASAAVLVLLSLSGLLAATNPSDERRFEDLTRRRDGAVIAVAPRIVETLPAGDPLRVGWDEFRRRNPGRWTILVDERTAMPTLVSGKGIDLIAGRELPITGLDELESAIRAFLAVNRDVLGSWEAVLLLDRDASVELKPGHWQIVFRQSVDGVTIENSRLDFHVVDGKLALFGSSKWGVPTIGGVPEIDARDARGSLDAYLGGLTELTAVGDPVLVLVAVDPARSPDGPKRWSGPRGSGLGHVLLWRFSYRDPGGDALWVGEIDAHDGTVRAFYDTTHYHAVRGGVYPEAPAVGCYDGDCEIEGFPMPFADWTESGQSPGFADEYGNLVCADPGASFETALQGQYARIDDDCGPLLETGSCENGLALGLKGGDGDCDVPPGASPGNTAAARTSYYHVNRVFEVARFYNPTLTALQEPIEVRTNAGNVCNASYASSTINLSRSGSNGEWECSNTGENQTIIVHEWGHHLDHNDGGGQDNSGEAYADVAAILSSRHSCVGRGMITDGGTCSGFGDTCLTCTGFRDFDWAERLANTPATPQGFVDSYCGIGSGPCGGAIHCESYPISEAIFDLATRDLPASGMDVDSAWQLVERLWYSTRAGSGGDIYNCALPDSDSCSASSWYQRMRAFDDDDGDPSNGTPHAAALYAAFARHNIACGNPGDPENQSTSGCPALARPVLTADETGPAPELTWTAIPEASEYVLYRGDLGCKAQFVPIATVTGGQTTYVDTTPDPDLPRFYRVEAVGANPSCRSAVSECEGISGEPRLQVASHGMIEVGANVNGNGFADPGETVQIPVELYNGGAADAFGVTGRLRTVDPSQGRVVAPLVSYPDLPTGTAAGSPAPHFELTLFESGAACGDTVELALDIDAEGAPTRHRGFSLQLGTLEKEFVGADPHPIPIVTQGTPVLSELEILEDHIITELDVTPHITHPYSGDLIVELISPQSTTVRLRANSTGDHDVRYDLERDPDGPGTMADFVGESTLGTWTIAVHDTLFQGPSTGAITGFTLHLMTQGAFDCEVSPCPEPTPTEIPDQLMLDKAIDGGDGSLQLIFDWAGVAGAAGYHVLHSPGPGFDAAVELTGRTDGATTLTAEGGAVTGSDVVFFQVRAVNVCNQESP
jgi:subtilisin-like proprotein convertase family protein